MLIQAGQIMPPMPCAMGACGATTSCGAFRLQEFNRDGLREVHSGSQARSRMPRQQAPSRWRGIMFALVLFPSLQTPCPRQRNSPWLCKEALKKQFGEVCEVFRVFLCQVASVSAVVSVFAHNLGEIS